MRAVVVSGNGPVFTAGLDRASRALTVRFMPRADGAAAVTDVELTTEGSDPARSAYYLRRKILEFQEAFTAIEECPKPVIAAIHSACVGGGVDLVTACCIRYCSADTFFSIKVRREKGAQCHGSADRMAPARAGGRCGPGGGRGHPSAATQDRRQ